MKKQDQQARLVYPVVLLLVACGRPLPAPQPVEMTPEPESQLQGITGLTVVPGTHQRLWLKDGVGVLGSDGQVVFKDPGAYDDVVALDANRIALIERNDGYVYEVSTHRLLNRFCYLPPQMNQTNPGTSQVSRVVGWGAVEQRLYVQALTFDANGQRVGGAQLGVFAADEATPLEWQDVGEPDMQAGGIAVESRDRIWLGWGSVLYLYDANAKAVQKRFSVQVSGISALAIDGDALLVLDGAGAVSSVALAGLK
jgi:hypothetical protein